MVRFDNDLFVYFISVSFKLNFRASKDDEDREVTEICETVRASAPRILSHSVNDTLYTARSQVYTKMNEILGYQT